MKGPHLLLLVHHPLATGVKHSESTQDGFLGVSPWGTRQPVNSHIPSLKAPPRMNFEYKGASLYWGLKGSGYIK